MADKKSHHRKPNRRPPTYRQLLKSAKDLLPLVEAEADESEKLHHMTDKLMGELRRTGLSAMMVPKALGGSEISYLEGLEIAEMVSHADASAGWCLMVHGVQGSSAGPFMPEKGVRKVYPKGRDTLVAGHGVPRGFARPVKGGYMVNGKWGYGSTIHHAEWIHTGCFISDDGKSMRLDEKGRPQVILAHHPRDTIKLTGNWKTLGLRGTGSFDYTTKTKELFVGEEYCYPFDHPTQYRGGIMYADGLPVNTTWGHTAWALGVGRRVLDEIIGIANSRADAFGKMQDGAGFLKEFAQAEAKYRAARAWIYEAWEDISETYARNKRASTHQITVIRLAMRHLHDVASEISTFAHKTSRGVSLRDSILQRCYRDIHSGTQHIFLADQILEDCGRVLVGATDAKTQWNVLGLSKY